MISDLKVGITGGIGAGKSIVSKVFKVLGIPVYDADTRAKWLMNYEQAVKSKIIESFGTKAYKKDELDREFIGAETFHNPDKLKILNAIVHPAVGEDYKQWAESQKSPYTLKEAALIFEAGSYKGLDRIIVVTAPSEIRIARVLRRDAHRSKKDIEAIMVRQWPEEEKIARADYIIKNDGREMILPQILSIDKALKELAGK